MSTFVYVGKVGSLLNVYVDKKMQNSYQPVGRWSKIGKKLYVVNVWPLKEGKKLQI